MSYFNNKAILCSKFKKKYSMLSKNFHFSIIESKGDVRKNKIKIIINLLNGRHLQGK